MFSPRTVRVRFISSIASADWAFSPGEVVDLEASQAKAWMRTGIVVRADEDAEVGAMAPAARCVAENCSEVTAREGMQWCLTHYQRLVTQRER